MRMIPRSDIVVLFLTLFLTCLALSQTTQMKTDLGAPVSGPASAPSVVRFGSLNINNLWLQICDDGRLGQDSASVRGLSYPMFQGGILYNDNLVWVGKVSDGRSPLIRTGGGIYRAGTGVRPGAITGKGMAEDPTSESTRVYRYRPDYAYGNLALDAAAVNGVPIANVTPEMVSEIRTSYAKDLSEWPWKKGAPFMDVNRNGVMDPGEEPGIANASQLAWFPYNDLDETVSKALAGDPPFGFEVQVTLWAYKGVPNLDDVIFKRYRIIYKGTAQTPANARIDSMYILQWIDPDIGSAADDLGGCDSLLDLAYGYNASHNGVDQDRIYQSLGLPTPGLGYTLLQGPIVPGTATEQGLFDFHIRPASKNLRMSSCAVHITGLGDGINESIGIPTYFYWNIARGCKPFLINGYSYYPWVDHQGKETRFMYYGDPVTRSGWIAGRPSSYWYSSPSQPDFSGGDARIFMNMGPFSMALGDTQEVVLAMIASPAPTSVQNATWLKNRAIYVRALYPNLGEYAAEYVMVVGEHSSVPQEFALDQNFPNPFNPSTQIRFTLPQEGQVSLSVFDLLGREAKVLYRGYLPSGQHIARWDGRDASGAVVPSGVYFYTLTSGDRQITRKMILLR